MNSSEKDKERLQSIAPLAEEYEKLAQHRRDKEKLKLWTVGKWEQPQPCEGCEDCPTPEICNPKEETKESQEKSCQDLTQRIDEGYKEIHGDG